MAWTSSPAESPQARRVTAKPRTQDPDPSGLCVADRAATRTRDIECDHWAGAHARGEAGLDDTRRRCPGGGVLAARLGLLQAAGARLP